MQFTKSITIYSQIYLILREFSMLKKILSIENKKTEKEI